jgi:NADPH-dependent glutamate synthase beta subunit-like oxidoreductase
LHLVKEIEKHIMEHDMSSMAEVGIFFRCGGIIRINWLNMYNVTIQELNRKFHIYLLLLCTNIGVFHVYVHKFQPSH